jgi:hypothetical protein
MIAAPFFCFQKKGPNEHPKMALVRTDLTFYLIDETPDIIGAMPGRFQKIFILFLNSESTKNFSIFFLFTFSILVKIDKKKLFILPKKTNSQPFFLNCEKDSVIQNSELVVDM